MLCNQEAWIADTGATVHYTPHAQGLIKSREPSPNDCATVGKGENMKTAIVGHMKGMITSKKGQVIMNVTLQDVVHKPESQFNLLHITKLMLEGWHLAGTKNSMSIHKK